MAEKIKVKTGVVRFSYVHVFEPRSVNGSDEKYSVCLLIDKKDKATVNAIQDAMKSIYEAEKNGAFKGKSFNAIKKPLRDGDDERSDDSNYAGMYFLNASSKTQPGVIDRAKNALDEDTFYSGCFGKAVLMLSAYNVSGGIGIAAYVNNILKTDDGERLAGQASAESDFADDLSDEEDDEDLLG